MTKSRSTLRRDLTRLLEQYEMCVEGSVDHTGAYGIACDWLEKVLRAPRMTRDVASWVFSHTRTDIAAGQQPNEQQCIVLAHIVEEIEQIAWRNACL